MKILRDDMQEGDRVLCWQTDRGEAVGTAILTKIERRNDGEEIYLRREECYTKPVPIRKLRQSDADLAEVKAFRSRGGTLFRTTPEEAALLLAACESRQYADPGAP